MQPVKHNKPLTSIPIQKLAPNFVTLLGLCLGITSIRYAFDGKWAITAALIIIAAFMDGIDGRLARILNATSIFGAQLDSLADVISFGVAPAVVLYLWSLHDIPYKGIGWAIVLFYIACSAIRLARFNSTLDSAEEQEKLQDYSTGVPITTSAGVALLPMILSFELLPEIRENNRMLPWFIAAYLVVIGLLMISRIPTFSFKRLHIRREYVSFILLIVALIMAGIILEPWIVLPILILIYLLTIPISIYFYIKSKKQ